jgi:hypothetical protein
LFDVVRGYWNGAALGAMVSGVGNLQTRFLELVASSPFSMLGVDAVQIAAKAIGNIVSREWMDQTIGCHSYDSN